MVMRRLLGALMGIVATTQEVTDCSTTYTSLVMSNDSNIGQTVAGTMAECIVACLANASCVAFSRSATVADESSAECFLKSQFNLTELQSYDEWNTITMSGTDCQGSYDGEYGNYTGGYYGNYEGSYDGEYGNYPGGYYGNYEGRYDGEYGNYWDLCGGYGNYEGSYDGNYEETPQPVEEVEDVAGVEEVEEVEKVEEVEEVEAASATVQPTPRPTTKTETGPQPIAVVQITVRMVSSMSADELQSDPAFVNSMQVVGAGILGLDVDNKDLIEITVIEVARRLASSMNTNLRRLESSVDILYTAKIPKEMAETLPETSLTATQMAYLFAGFVSSDYGSVDTDSLEELEATLAATISEAIAFATPSPTPAPTSGTTYDLSYSSVDVSGRSSLACAPSFAVVISLVVVSMATLQKS